jgi:hypothetical protein
MFQNGVPFLVCKDGMKKSICFSCYLLELIEKSTLYVRIVKGKNEVQGVGYRVKGQGSGIK